MLLQFDGHTVEASNSGRDALAMFEPGRFDLVITDYAMPEMNGNQLADAIKADAPDQPVIMITGHSGTFLPSPSVDFLIGKPFQMEHLREAIAKVMLEASTPA
jgi:CheY-like chemotaxis protein